MTHHGERPRFDKHIGKVHASNPLVHFTFRALDAVALARRRGLWVHGLLEQPEHLGIAELGHPAIIRTLPDAQKVLSSQSGCFTMAFF